MHKKNTKDSLSVAIWDNQMHMLVLQLYFETKFLSVNN